MFVKEYDKFKKDVKQTIFAFFRMEPEQLSFEIEEYHKKYDKLYNLDTVSYKDVRPELKDMIMKYRTMVYFNNIWIKLNELEPCIMDIGGIDD